IRARTRVTGESSTRESTPEKTVTAAKNPTTAQAHGVYEGGKSVSETATAPTTTRTARSRTSQRPGRLSIPFLQPRERPGRELAGGLVGVFEVAGHRVPFAVATHVACRHQRVQPHRRPSFRGTYSRAKRFRSWSGSLRSQSRRETCGVASSGSG